ncbi:hypothetical protein Tco_1387717, partial [Tanacetum coccineum]
MSGWSFHSDNLFAGDKRCSYPIAIPTLPEVTARNERFGKPVNNHPDRILTSRRLWQFGYEVHGDLFLLPLGNL